MELQDIYYNKAEYVETVILQIWSLYVMPN
jgi:hypothetical protein